jgi:hypothetical protein
VSEWTLDDISEKLREIDFAMLMTHAETGDIAGRPIATTATSNMMATPISLRLSKLEQWPILNVIQGWRFPIEGLLGKPPLFITLQGKHVR